MTFNLDERIVRSLDAAARAAPGPAPDFETRLMRRRHHRRRTRIAYLATATAAVLALAGGVAAVGLSTRTPTAVADQPPLDAGAARPGATVWPQALVTLPRLLPDGRFLGPAGRIDEDHILVIPGSDAHPRQLPVVFNVRTADVRELMPTLPADYGQVDIGWASVSGASVLWTVSVTRPDQSRTIELWSAPRAGGASTRRHVFNGDRVITAAEIGGVLYASLTQTVSGARSPAYRLPDDGTLVPVDGEFGGLLDDRGWTALDSPRRSLAHRTPPTFANLTTGERRTVRVPAGTTWDFCGPDVCVGHDADEVVSFRWDGSAVRRIGNLPTEWVNRLAAPPTSSPRVDEPDRPPNDTVLGDSYRDGRFLRMDVFASSTTLLWDREAGVVATIESSSTTYWHDAIGMSYTDTTWTFLDLNLIT